MADTQNYKEYQRIFSKDISNLMGVSPRTAEHYYSDIKNHFDVLIVTYQHFKQYFKLQ